MKLLPVHVALVPFPGPQVLGIVRRQGEVPPFLLRRQAVLLDGAGLTILLSRCVLVGAAPFVETPLPEHFALRTNQAVTVVDEFPGGDHAGLVPRMYGPVARAESGFRHGAGHSRLTLSVTVWAGRGVAELSPYRRPLTAATALKAGLTSPGRPASRERQGCPGATANDVVDWLPSLVSSPDTAGRPATPMSPEPWPGAGPPRRKLIGWIPGWASFPGSNALSGYSMIKVGHGLKERTILEVDTAAAHVVEGDAEGPDRRITDKGKGWREEALAP